MKQNYEIANPGFTVIDGELVRVSFEKVIVSEDHIFYYTHERGLLKDIVTYADTQSFEEGVKTSRIADFGGEISEDGKVEAYHMVDGEPKKEFVDVDLKFDFGWLNPIYDEGFYESRTECIKHNTYIEVDEDGNRKEHIGILKKIELTDEQKKFVEDVLTPALKKADELGIALITSYEQVIHAFNMSNFKRIGFDCCREDYRSTDIGYMTPIKGAEIYVVGDDTVIYDCED